MLCLRSKLAHALQKITGAVVPGLMLQMHIEHLFQWSNTFFYNFFVITKVLSVGKELQVRFGAL